MYGMFVIDIIYDLTPIIDYVNVQCHPSNSEKRKQTHTRSRTLNLYSVLTNHKTYA